MLPASSADKNPTNADAAMRDSLEESRKHDTNPMQGLLTTKYGGFAEQRRLLVDPAQEQTHQQPAIAQQALVGHDGEGTDNNYISGAIPVGNLVQQPAKVPTQQLCPTPMLKELLAQRHPTPEVQNFPTQHPQVGQSGVPNESMLTPNASSQLFTSNVYNEHHRQAIQVQLNHPRQQELVHEQLLQMTTQMQQRLFEPKNDAPTGTQQPLENQQNPFQETHERKDIAFPKNEVIRDTPEVRITASALGAQSRAPAKVPARSRKSSLPPNILAGARVVEVDQDSLPEVYLPGNIYVHNIKNSTSRKGGAYKNMEIIGEEGPTVRQHLQLQQKQQRKFHEEIEKQRREAEEAVLKHIILQSQTNAHMEDSRRIELEKTKQALCAQKTTSKVGSSAPKQADVSVVGAEAITPTNVCQVATPGHQKQQNQTVLEEIYERPMHPEEKRQLEELQQRSLLNRYPTLQQQLSVQSAPRLAHTQPLARNEPIHIAYPPTVHPTFQHRGTAFQPPRRQIDPQPLRYASPQPLMVMAKKEATSEQRLQVQMEAQKREREALQQVERIQSLPQVFSGPPTEKPTVQRLPSIAHLIGMENKCFDAIPEHDLLLQRPDVSALPEPNKARTKPAPKSSSRADPNSQRATQPRKPRPPPTIPRKSRSKKAQQVQSQQTVSGNIGSMAQSHSIEHSLNPQARAILPRQSGYEPVDERQKVTAASPEPQNAKQPVLPQMRNPGEQPKMTKEELQLHRQELAKARLALDEQKRSELAEKARRETEQQQLLPQNVQQLGGSTQTFVSTPQVEYRFQQQSRGRQSMTSPVHMVASSPEMSVQEHFLQQYELQQRQARLQQALANQNQMILKTEQHMEGRQSTQPSRPPAQRTPHRRNARSLTPQMQAKMARKQQILQQLLAQPQMPDQHVALQRQADGSLTPVLLTGPRPQQQQPFNQKPPTAAGPGNVGRCPPNPILRQVVIEPPNSQPNVNNLQNMTRTAPIPVAPPPPPPPAPPKYYVRQKKDPAKLRSASIQSQGRSRAPRPANSDLADAPQRAVSQPIPEPVVEGLRRPSEPLSFEERGLVQFLNVFDEFRKASFQSLLEKKDQAWDRYEQERSRQQQLKEEADRLAREQAQAGQEQPKAADGQPENEGNQDANEEDVVASGTAFKLPTSAALKRKQQLSNQQIANRLVHGQHLEVKDLQKLKGALAKTYNEMTVAKNDQNRLTCVILDAMIGCGGGSVYTMFSDIMAAKVELVDKVTVEVLKITKKCFPRQREMYLAITLKPVASFDNDGDPISMPIFDSNPNAAKHYDVRKKKQEPEKKLGERELVLQDGPMQQHFNREKKQAMLQIGIQMHAAQEARTLAPLSVRIEELEDEFEGPDAKKARTFFENLNAIQTLETTDTNTKDLTFSGMAMTKEPQEMRIVLTQEQITRCLAQIETREEGVELASKVVGLDLGDDLDDLDIGSLLSNEPSKTLEVFMNPETGLIDLDRAAEQPQKTEEQATEKLLEYLMSPVEASDLVFNEEIKEMFVDNIGADVSKQELLNVCIDDISLYFDNYVERDTSEERTVNINEALVVNCDVVNHPEEAMRENTEKDTSKKVTSYSSTKNLSPQEKEYQQEIADLSQMDFLSCIDVDKALPDTAITEDVSFEDFDDNWDLLKVIATDDDDDMYPGRSTPAIEDEHVPERCSENAQKTRKCDERIWKQEIQDDIQKENEQNISLKPTKRRWDEKQPVQPTRILKKRTSALTKPYSSSANTLFLEPQPGPSSETDLEYFNRMAAVRKKMLKRSRWGVAETGEVASELADLLPMSSRDSSLESNREPSPDTLQKAAKALKDYERRRYTLMADKINSLEESNKQEAIEQLRAQIHKERMEYFKKKLRIMKASVKTAAIQNSAFVNEMSRLSQKIKTTLEEQRVICRRVCHHYRNYIRRLSNAKKRKLENIKKTREFLEKAITDAEREKIITKFNLQWRGYKMPTLLPIGRKVKHSFKIMETPKAVQKRAMMMFLRSQHTKKLKEKQELAAKRDRSSIRTVGSTTPLTGRCPAPPQSKRPVGRPPGRKRGPVQPPQLSPPISNDTSLTRENRVAARQARVSIATAEKKTNAVLKAAALLHKKAKHLQQQVAEPIALRPPEPLPVDPVDQEMTETDTVPSTQAPEPTMTMELGVEAPGEEQVPKKRKWIRRKPKQGSNEAEEVASLSLGEEEPKTKKRAYKKKTPKGEPKAEEAIEKDQFTNPERVKAPKKRGRKSRSELFLLEQQRIEMEEAAAPAVVVDDVASEVVTAEEHAPDAELDIVVTQLIDSAGTAQVPDAETQTSEQRRLPKRQATVTGNYNFVRKRAKNGAKALASETGRNTIEEFVEMEQGTPSMAVDKTSEEREGRLQRLSKDHVWAVDKEEEILRKAAEDLKSRQMSLKTPTALAEKERTPCKKPTKTRDAVVKDEESPQNESPTSQKEPPELGELRRSYTKTAEKKTETEREARRTSSRTPQKTSEENETCRTPTKSSQSKIAKVDDHETPHKKKGQQLPSSHQTAPTLLEPTETTEEVPQRRPRGRPRTKGIDVLSAVVVLPETPRKSTKDRSLSATPKRESLARSAKKS